MPTWLATARRAVFGLGNLATLSVQLRRTHAYVRQDSEAGRQYPSHLQRSNSLADGAHDEWSRIAQTAPRLASGLEEISRRADRFCLSEAIAADPYTNGWAAHRESAAAPWWSASSNERRLRDSASLMEIVRVETQSDYLTFTNTDLISLSRITLNFTETDLPNHF